MQDYSRFEFLQVEVKDRVAVVTLNRPDVLNAINPPMHRELDDIFEDFSLDNDVNAIVLTGAGRAFCAGGDIHGMSQRISEEPPRLSSISSGSRLITNMLEVGQPIIAAV
ncbi:MAG: enoyl-CoA hydratase/isomerase family protein, partial [Dehalococcoidia bacterium]